MAIDQLKIKDRIYDIGANASNVSFDNTSTSYQSTNVQDALIEIDSSLTDLIQSDTTANWNLQPSLIAEKDHIYIYTDHARLANGTYVPGVKIGTGNAYLVDLAFVNGDLKEIIQNHINDNIRHITAAERNSWNSKVRCFISDGEEEHLIFTTN